MRTDTTNKPAIEDRVLQSLSSTKPQTVKEIAEAAGLGRSTVSKQLIAFERDNKAVRTDGGRDHGRRAPDRWTTPTSNRLRPGQLKSMVLNYINTTDKPVGPVAISRALDRSSGAVANCLATLARDREIHLVEDKPLRYTRNDR